jgi:hypothetical protein
MAVIRWILFGGMFVLFGVLLLLRSELHGLVKREHPELWHRKQTWRWGGGFPGESGGPTPLSFSSSQLAQLGNSEVDRLAKLMSVVRVAFFVVFVLAVLSLLSRA